MKKLFFFSLLLWCGTTVIAQKSVRSAESEAAIKAVVAQTTRDAYALRQAEYDASFADPTRTFRAYNNRSGYQIAPAQAPLTTAFGTKPRDMNPVLENFTFGFYDPDAAFVTYDQYLYGKDQKPSKEIRMMERRNGLWKTAHLVALFDYGQNPFEEASVRKVIDTETRAYHEANPTLVSAQWSDKPYVERLQSDFVQPLGTPFLKGENLRAFADSHLKTVKPSGHTVRLSDYDVHISGATAWASFTQEELDASGTVVKRGREMRILEREAGGWKLVFLGLHAMK